MSSEKAETGATRPRRKAAAKAAPAKKRAARKPSARKPAATGAARSAPAATGEARTARRRRWTGPLIFAAKAAFIAALMFVTVTGGWVLAYLFVNPPATPLMLLRHYQEEEDIRKRWRDYDEISPEFLLAVVAAEDQLFFKHRGFDTKQIRAAIETRLDGGNLRGGSTISQQVAKNLFLWPGRSWIRKGLEAWFTVAIETCWPKERILEMYVNVAELGPGIYGAEAAAQHFYNKAAGELNREESALLASVLPAPRTRSPRQPTPYLRERQAWIMGQMHNLGGPAYRAAR